LHKIEILFIVYLFYLNLVHSWIFIFSCILLLL